jgi:hypothetical protein
MEYKESMKHLLLNIENVIRKVKSDIKYYEAIIEILSDQEEKFFIQQRLSNCRLDLREAESDFKTYKIQIKQYGIQKTIK